MPKSWSEKKKAEMNGKFEDSNRDLDNYVKAIQDCLEGFAFDNDNQVVQYKEVKKVWSTEGKIGFTINKI